MSKPPPWFANAMRDAIRKDHAILFLKSLTDEDRRLLIWALRQTRRLRLTDEERDRCSRLLEQQAQLEPCPPTKRTGERRIAEAIGAGVLDLPESWFEPVEPKP